MSFSLLLFVQLIDGKLMWFVQSRQVTRIQVRAATWLPANKPLTSLLFVGKAGLILQPIFFRSLAFVEGCRRDVDRLLSEFSVALQANDVKGSPFTIFKALWRSTGWQYIHIAVVEQSLRAEWWDVVVRCFAGQLSFARESSSQLTAVQTASCLVPRLTAFNLAPSLRSIRYASLSLKSAALPFFRSN